MTQHSSKHIGWLALFLMVGTTAGYSSLRQKPTGGDGPRATKKNDTSMDATNATPSEGGVENASKPKEETTTEEVQQPVQPVKPAAKRIERANAFVAGPDWEFDGFVSGGQDSAVRSMFYLNDLVYLNIGAQQGVSSGDKIGIYKRGDKVRDPQTGKFIGYEVRRAAIARATDRVEDETCAVRILATYEAVELGDLVRREQ